METYKAVYQEGCTIFGIGKTEEEAIEDAKQWVDNPEELQNDIVEYPQYEGDMILIDISKALYDHVKEFGGQVAIEEDEDEVYKLPEEIPEE